MTELERLAAKHAHPPAGLVLAHGSEVVAGGPIGVDSVFELGSITKVVTGMLLADMVSRDEVTLESTLDEFFPGARPLTLSSLATHTSGLPRLPLALLRRHGLRNPNPYSETTVDELVSDLARVRVRGPRFRYSNFGFALLGQALAARAGMSYEALVTERFPIEGVFASPVEVVQPHSRRGKPVPPWTLGAYAPAGCLRGTASGILGLIELARSSSALTVHAKRGPLEVGLGWMRLRDVWWHNGGTGGTRCHCAFRVGGSATVALANIARPPDAILRGML